MRQGPDIEIVRTDARWCVVAKPPGLLSVPGKGPANQDCVAARVRRAFPHATGPLIVHRLDMETSGLMVLALDAEAHRALSMQFEARTTRKAYVALVPIAFAPTPHSPPADPLAPPPDGAGSTDASACSGVIDLPMRLDVDRRPRQVIDHRLGRAARTAWTLLAREGGALRLRLEPITGRTHQLRLHCLHGLGRAILGDRLYGPEDTAPAATRLMLHATRLEFIDPGTGGTVAVEHPCPF